MPAIRAEGLSKEYFLGGGHRADTFRELLSSLFRPSAYRQQSSGKQAPERFWALKDVSFDVAPGEVVGVIGRNGAGKSTLLKILSRITEPTAGRAELWGRVGSLLEVGTGFHPELSGRENIFLNGSLLGMSRREIGSRFDEIVAFSEVERFIDTPVKRYSSGMYVRLAFAVAAHLEPEILIVDEVLAVGDAEFQKKCIGKMEIAGKEGRTILFVSHNLSAVKTLCGRAIVLQNGELVFDGDVLEGVGRYLRRDTTESDLIVWNDREAPSIPSARLMQVGILDGGKQAGTDMCTERPIQVRIRFSVFREARIGTSVLLHNTDGVLVFSSHSNHEPRWHGKDRPPGIYRSICEIPANFLAEGRYSITVKFWEGIGQQGIEEKDVLWFSAHARGLVRGDRPYPQTGAATMPLFRWTSEREE